MTPLPTPATCGLLPAPRPIKKPTAPAPARVVMVRTAWSVWPHAIRVSTSEAQSLLNLEGRINVCRTEHQKLPALAYESQELLALSSFVAEQSRGMMTQVSISGGAEPWFQAGEDYFFQRRGQLNLACHQCHDQSWGEMLRGDRLSQGQPNAFLPIDWSGSRWALCIDGCKTARLGSEPNLKPWALAPISGWNSTWCGVREVWLWNHPGCADKTEKGKVRGCPR